MSLDIALFPHVGDAITALTNNWEWIEVEDSVADVVAACKDIVESWYSDMLIGMVQTFLIIPSSGWLLLDGATHDKVDYPELHALLPSHLKTVNDFTLPDMTGSFSAYTDTVGEIGDQSGDNLFSLTIGQLPAHTHTEIPAIAGVDVGGAGPPLPSSVVGSPVSTSSVGDGDDVDNRPLNTLLVFAVFSGRG